MSIQIMTLQEQFDEAAWCFEAADDKIEEALNMLAACSDYSQHGEIESIRSVLWNARAYATNKAAES